MYDKDIMNRKKETAVTVIAKRFLASILCLSMLLTAVFPDGGTAFAASLNQELPSAVSEGSVNKLSDSSSEEDIDSETMPSTDAADADDASKERQEAPLAPAVGGEPLPAEELAREEELFKKRAEAAGDGFIRLDDLDGSDDGYRRGSYDNAFDSKLLAAELEKDDSGRKESPIVSEDTGRRTAFQKVYRLEDGTSLAAVYPEAVHYEDGGEWKDIDNSLLPDKDAKGGKALKNASGEVSFRLPDSLSSEKDVSLSYGGYSISFRFEGSLSEMSDASVKLSDGSAILREGIEVLQTAGTGETKSGEEPATTDESATAAPESKDGETEASAEPSTESAQSAAISAETGTAAEEKAEETSDSAGEALATSSRLTAASASKASVKQPGELFAKEAGASMSDNMRQVMSAAHASEVTYHSVLPDTDISYQISSSRLKESIILRSTPETPSAYSFVINADGLKLSMQDDGSICAYDAEGSEVFEIPAPFMEDAAGEASYGVGVELEEKDSAYCLTYVPDHAWLADGSRAYPVAIDPVVIAKQIQTNIRDRTIASNTTYSVTAASLYVGRYNGGACRSLIKFLQLPAMTAGDVIVDARVQLYRSASGSAQLQVNAHEMLGVWDSDTVTWANQPAHVNGNIADYDLVSGTAWYSWKVTDIVRKWYSGTDSNTGLMLRAADSVENGSSSNYKAFCSSDHGTSAARPVLVMQYMNSCGLEGYWDYDTVSAGRAGMGYINLFSGNLTWVHSGLAYDGSRMPAAINLVYSANDKANSSFGFGYGWRSSYNQLVYKWVPGEGTTADTDYYIWEDEDGTRHFFRKQEGSSTTFKDESGIEMTLTTGGSGSSKYCITDKTGNKSFFDTQGRLRQIKNNQATASSIIITYRTSTDRRISTVKDGVNRVYQFGYTSDGSLVTSITYKGTGSEPIKTLMYDYANGDLGKITYPDDNYVTYHYYLHMLDRVQNFDSRGVEFGFDNHADNNPNRVVSVRTYDSGNGGGSNAYYWAYYAYFPNYTVASDEQGNSLQYQFNNYGNTVAIQDTEGKAVYTKWAKDRDQSAKSNQAVIDSRLQSPVGNLILNGWFSYDGNWTASAELGASGSHGYSADHHWIGSRSYRLDMTSSTGCVQAGPTQAVPVEGGATYTLSAYVKVTGISGGSGLQFVVDVSGTSIASDAVAAVGDWQRLEMTFTVPQGASSIQPWVRWQSRGTVYFDCVQLEKSASAGRFNLVENGDFFYRGGTASDASGWTREEAASASSDKRVSTAGTGAAELDSHAFTIVGAAAQMKHVSQRIDVSGSAGDTYSLGGWAKGDVAPMTDDGRSFCVLVQFMNSDGSNDIIRANFNPDLNGSGDTWQYSCERAVAKKNYNYIRVVLAFDRNVNQVWFDGIHLYKDEFGNSYTYDDNGNVISVSDLQKKNTTYEYSSNNLTKAVLPNQARLKYTYDSCHNVKTAISGEEVKDTFTYDTYGNNTSVKVVDPANSSAPAIEANAVYASNGNYLSSVTDGNRGTVTYGYNTQTGLLEWVQGLGDNSFNQVKYKYNAMQQLTGVSKYLEENDGVANGRTSTVSYTYIEDNLNTSTHGGTTGTPTTYTFSYGAFNALSEAKAGGHRLIENTYDVNYRTFNLTSEKYGNNQRVNYTYDSTGRMLSKAWEGNSNDRVEYVYDNEEGLAAVRDVRNNITTKYIYDLSDRLVQTRQTGSVNRQGTVAYDDMNNVASFKDWISGVLYETKYTYDKDSRQTSIVGAGLTRLWNYDAYGRTKEIITKNAAGQQILKSELVYPIPDSAHTIPRANGWRNTAAGFSQLLEYGYYSSGNISIVRDNVNGANYEVRYSYDKLSRLTAEFNGKKDRKYVYTYDSSGNITSKKEYRWSDNALLHTYNYTYGDATWGDLLTGYDGRTITSDTIGNMTNDGIWRYTWEHGRQLASQRKISTGQVISYTYDTDGLRLSKMIGNNGKKYFYDKGRLSCMVNVIGGVAFDSYYIHYDAEGNPAFISASVNGDIREKFVYLRNMQGDIIGLVNESGAVVVRYYYDAWGKLLQTEVSNSAYNDIAEKNPLRYRGYVYDAETGMYYLNQRYYNPEICRFISSDNATVVTLTPEAIGCNKNLFAYCDNNPLIRNDDSGDCWFLANMGVYAAGACIGIATQYICNVGCSLSKGESLIKALNPFSSSSGIDYAAAAISGAIATTKISCMGSAVVNGLLGGMAYSLNCEMNGVKTDPFQFGLSVGIGVISGFVGRDGADAVRNVKKYKSISNISKTLVSKKKIALYTGKLSVIKKGILGSIKNTVIAGVTANMGNGARRRLTGYVI